MNSFDTQLHSDESNEPTHVDLLWLMQMAAEQEADEVNAELAAIAADEAEERAEAEAVLMLEEIEEFEAEEYEPTDGDWHECVDHLHDMQEFDGQPSEYDEWQDYMGGDDWDHGQYDEF